MTHGADDSHTNQALLLACRQSPPAYLRVDAARGTASYLVQNQAPGADPAAFSGSKVALADAVFKVKGPQAIPTATVAAIQVGSTTDPVFLSATTSNGDDISKAQGAAQVRHCLFAV